MVYQAEGKGSCLEPRITYMFSIRDILRPNRVTVTGQSIVTVANRFLDTHSGEMCLDPCPSSVVYRSDLMISRLQ